ncbi:type II secretion system protein [Frigoriglobus tundricola]|uniref:Prepilin-type N-terminal cleavage/methylation domain-containing protein n=1 Tax=Frigoriglobus tundricola TaxID=2774151 RepID=A0A6M5YVS0_9BACT|nr:prepilin-type N-terminal cleavage/methylation domain-containing protein [Frigoriglobus tundricola]QJW97476.1 hypothetical protein FTUN_5050 [Frigoriglobus tundricola]
MKLATRARSATGFTLVELLVVLTIILVVLALSGAAYQKATDGQRGRTTDDLMKRLQPALDAEYDSVVKQCARDKPDNTNTTYQSVLAWCNGDPDRARAVWTAANLRRQFPQTFAEVKAGTVPVCPGVTFPVLTTFNSLSGLTSSPSNLDFESAALLYVILSKKAAGSSGGFAADDVTNGLQMDLTFVGGTAKAFRDAWGNPICFHLWWQGAEVQAPPYVDGKATYTDPLDPIGATGMPRVLSWSNATNQQFLQNYPYFFTGQNRIATVWSYGRNGKSDNLAPGTDDRAGFRLRRLDTSGGNEP